MDNTFDTHRKKGIVINGIDGLVWKGNRLKNRNKELGPKSRYINLSNTKVVESEGLEGK